MEGVAFLGMPTARQRAARLCCTCWPAGRGGSQLRAHAVAMESARQGARLARRSTQPGWTPSLPCRHAGCASGPHRWSQGLAMVGPAPTHDCGCLVPADSCAQPRRLWRGGARPRHADRRAGGAQVHRARGRGGPLPPPTPPCMPPPSPTQRACCCCGGAGITSQDLQPVAPAAPGGGCWGGRCGRKQAARLASSGRPNRRSLPLAPPAPARRTSTSMWRERWVPAPLRSPTAGRLLCGPSSPPRVLPRLLVPPTACLAPIPPSACALPCAAGPAPVQAGRI